MDECSTAALDTERMTLEDVCFVHLYVQDMALFARVNAAYCQFFGQYMPPSRSCVEVASLPARVLLDCIGIRGSGASKLLPTRVVRDVLHIASVSAWAPNCIGPYSQANILHKALILLAGQVAFLPQTMAIVGADHAAQMRQSLRNAGRVLEALESNLRHVCSAVVYVANATGETLAAVADHCRAQLIANAGLADRFEDVVDSDESDDELDKDAERVKLAAQTPLLVVQVSRLPRDALVEVELQAFCHRVLKHLRPASSAFTRSDSDAHSSTTWMYAAQFSSIPRALCLAMCAATRNGSHDGGRLVTAAVHQVARGIVTCIAQTFAAAQLPWDRAVHFRVFYCVAAFESELVIATGASLDVRARVCLSTLCTHVVLSLL